jgi:hypothetical protein
VFELIKEEEKEVVEVVYSREGQEVRLPTVFSFGVVVYPMHVSERK